MKRVVDRAVNAFLAATLLAMTLIVFVQVFYRYVLNHPLSWPEETARVLIVWLSFVGGYMALRENKHIGFNLFVKKLPENARRVVEIVGRVLVIFFLIVVIWQGWIFAHKSLSILMPYTGISVGWFVYSVFPVSGVLLLAQSLIELVHSISALGGSAPQRA